VYVKTIDNSEKKDNKHKKTYKSDLISNKEEYKMKEVQSLLKIIADGLKTLAQGVEAIAEKVNEAAKTRGPAKARSKKPSTVAKKAKVAKKPAPKPTRAKVDKSATAAETVLNVINSSKTGIDTAGIKEKTGYDQKKVANIIYKLKKQGKIKTTQKGVYEKS
jgi:hypothetical protein